MPRSWVIRMIDRPRSVANVHQQPQDLRLDGHVERRGRLVGDQDLRIAGERHARSSRAGACRRRIRADSCRTGASDRESRPARRISIAAARASRGVEALVIADALGDLVADPHHRVEMAGRVLEDHADLAAAHLAASRLPSSRVRSRPSSMHASRRRSAAARDGSRRPARGRAGSCPSRSRRPGRGSRPCRDRARPHRAACACRHRRRGRPSGRGRRAAARSFVHPEQFAEPVAEHAEAEGEETMERPGNSVIHQAVVMKLWPSATMTPHSAIGGWTPRPR